MDVQTLPRQAHPDSEPARPDLCVILNPGSGKKKDRGVRGRIEAALARHPERFSLRAVPKGGDIAEEAERAVREGFGTLIAAGGDGTISAVAAVAHKHGRTIGVLPMGTFNYFARGLDLPEEIEDAVDLVASGITREIPVAEVNGKLFLNNASLGLYPAILQQREGTYRRWGRSRLAAHWSVLVTFMRFHRPLSLKVIVDGEPIRTRTPLAFVARSDYQLEVFGLDGVEDVRDGRFAVFLAPDSSRWGLLLFAIRLAWRSMEQGRDFDYFTGEKVDIETRSKARLVARDGERERMRSPFRFRVLEEPLKVIAPGGSAR
jgi:diacylglycerol kinase family enzyme